MPLYEYLCRSCGHRFEVIRKFSDPPEKTCPKCGAEVEKLFSSPAIQFKGSGFYITDYGRKGDSGDKGSKPATGSSDSSSGSTSSSSSESKSGDSKSSDSKPAADASASKPAKTDKAGS
jgi:putative FmdB family regulatory protein